MSQACLIWDALDDLRSTGQVCGRMPLLGLVCYFSHDYTGVVGLEEEEYRDTVPPYLGKMFSR